MKIYLYFVGILLSICVLVGCNTAPEANIESSVDWHTEMVNVQYSDFIAYEDILADYAALVDYRLSDSFEVDWNNGEIPRFSDTLNKASLDNLGERATNGVSLDVKWSNMVVEMTAGLVSPHRTCFGYVLFDLNHDDVPELFWVREDLFILAVFALSDGAPVLIDAFWPQYKCVITEAGNLYTVARGGASYSDYTIRELSTGEKLETIVQFGISGNADENDLQYYEIVNQEKIKIDVDRFIQLTEEHPVEMGVELCVKGI